MGQWRGQGKAGFFSIGRELRGGVQAGEEHSEGLEVRGELPVRGAGRRASGWGLARSDEAR